MAAALCLAADNFKGAATLWGGAARWSVAAKIAAAWLTTLPPAGLLAYGAELGLRAWGA